MTIKKKAINIFLKNTNYSLLDIKKTIFIHAGYTNTNLFIKTSDNESYLVRISNNDFIDRKNEYLFLKSINQLDQYLFFDKFTGDAIKIWTKGKNPTKKQSKSIKFILSLKKEIDLFHKSHKLNNQILKHDFFQYINKANLTLEQKNIYKYLVKMFFDDKRLVMSHNDINPDNILTNKKGKILFIDFEYARLNIPEWDIVNYLREINISKIKIFIVSCFIKIKYQKIIQLIFLSLLYSLQWSYSIKENKKINNYRNNLIEQINKLSKSKIISKLKAIM